jgi:hypothetical protein
MLTNAFTVTAGTVYVAADQPGLYRSTDGGDSWQPTGGLRISLDGGLSWQAYPGAIGGLPITTMTVVEDEGGTRLYIGTVGRTIVGQASSSPATADGSFLGGGVYVGRTHWHALYLPMLLRASP